MAQIIEDLAADWRRLDERIEGLSSDIELLARKDAGCERLMSVPEIGPLISSAMVAAIGAGDAFSRGATSPRGWAKVRCSRWGRSKAVWEVMLRCAAHVRGGVKRRRRGLSGWVSLTSESGPPQPARVCLRGAIGRH
jgi:transposase